MNADETSNAQIDLPVNLLPDLSVWGIEETLSRGVCLDNLENRRKIKENRGRYRPVYDSEGQPTDHIQVISDSMEIARLTVNRGVILTDLQDPESDYITGVRLLALPAADDIVPTWVLAATKTHLEILKERKRREEEGISKPYRPYVMSVPGRCRATNNLGYRCMRWHDGSVGMNGLCRSHLTRQGESGVNTLAKARNRLIQASLAAVEKMEDLMLTATSESVQQRSAEQILDRAGLRGGTEISMHTTVDATAAVEEIKRRLERLAPKPEPDPETDLGVIDAEVIEP